MHTRTRIALFVTALILAGCVNGTPFEPAMCEIVLTESGEWVWPDGFDVSKCRVYPIKTTYRKGG